MELDALVNKEAVFEAHRLVGHRLIDAESVDELGGQQVAMLESALERCTRDPEMDPAIDVVARGALQPAALLLGQTGGRGGVLRSDGHRPHQQRRRRGESGLEYAA